MYEVKELFGKCRRWWEDNTGCRDPEWINLATTGSIAGFCEQDTEPSTYLQFGEFSEQIDQMGVTKIFQEWE